MSVANLFVFATVAAAAYTPLPPKSGLAARSKIFAPATDTAARANIVASAADAIVEARATAEVSRISRIFVRSRG